MEYKILGHNKDIVFVGTNELIIKDTQSALDFIMSVKYETGCEKIILNKSCLTDEFFILSTGCAGEILQKFVTIKSKRQSSGTTQNTQVSL